MYPAVARQLRRVSLPPLFAVILAAIVLLTGVQAEKLGDRFQIALPLMGMACSVANGQGPEYLLRYGVMFTGLHSVKFGLGDAEINQRPNGGDRGMPSGHTATAVFGASTLLHECAMNSLPMRAAVILAAGFTGASRMDAGAHDIWQVLAGTLWGLACDRALRRHAPSRARVRAQFQRLGRSLANFRRKIQCSVQQLLRLRWPLPPFRPRPRM